MNTTKLLVVSSDAHAGFLASVRGLLGAGVLAATIVLPCGCGGGGGSGPTATTASPGAKVYTNPHDSRLLTVVDVAGNRTAFFGIKDVDGRIVEATYADVTIASAELVVVRFDDEQRPYRYEMPDGGGLRFDWMPDQIVRVRQFDPLGAIREDLWIDVVAGVEVANPGTKVTAPATWSSSGETVLAGLFAANDPLTVRVNIEDCNGVVSANSAQAIEKVVVELETQLGTIRNEAVREGGVFVAEMPRNPTPYQWGMEQCESMLEWTGGLCTLSNEVSVSQAVEAICATIGLMTSGAVQFYCALASAATTVYCADAEIGAEAACAAASAGIGSAVGGAGLLSIVDVSEWLLGPRTLRSIALVRTCDGIEERFSESKTVTSDNLSETLRIDGCELDSAGSHSMGAAINFIGTGFLSSDGTGQVFEQYLPPPWEWIDINATSLALGPHSKTGHCYWPQYGSPVYDVEIVESGWLGVELNATGGRARIGLGVARIPNSLAVPTPEQEPYAAAGLESCMTSPRVLEGSLSGGVTIELRPFQKLVVTVNLFAECEPWIEHEFGASLGFPPDVPGMMASSGTVPGSIILEITHDQVRQGWENFLAQQQEGAEEPEIDFSTQCLPAFVAIGDHTVIVVDDEVEATTVVTLEFDYRIESQ